ncbi:BTAD domain-containing putative transcriptional regulator [Streptomyces sp. NPDC002588]|uniref:AfsR/SARP family transcriptional regulator n=1 Tax=Streptomyces sp. NPDC002588 TaxID=3154419 RepID=UPI00331CD2F2
MTVEFGVLGSVEAGIDGRPVALGHTRQRGVLAVLLVDVGHPVTTDQLIYRVWGDRPPRQARTTLRGYLSRLRQALATTGEAVIARQPGGYALTTAGTVTVDMHSFRRLAEQARAADDDTLAAALFEQALRLWRAEPFSTLDTPWLNALRDALVQERLAAQLDLNDLRLRLGQHTALLPELSARATEHPLDERLAGQLMLALHRCGRSAEALDHYHRTRDRLARELGIDPGPALRDIQSAVLRQDAVPQPAAPAQSSPAPAQLPLSIAAFTGRDGELAQLDHLLLSTAEAGPVRPAAVVISAVSGTAGVGKTALAVHWARRVRDSFPDGQLHVNLRGFDPGGATMDPAEAVRGFLDAFGVPPARVPAGLDAQVGLYRSLLADKRVLVVLDNARDAEQVRPLLPGAPGCLALITSRNRLTSLAAAEGAQLLPVDLLAPAQAGELLTNRIGGDRAAAEPAAVAEIIARCAGLPLALAVVAARAAAQPHLPLAVLAGELRESGTRLDALDGGDTVTRIRAVFSWSYRAMSPDAARLFRLLGLHPGPDIGVPAVAGLAGIAAGQARTLVAELVGANLLTEHAPGRYAYHDLLRAYATELANTLDSEADRHTATRRMLDHYLHTARTADAVLTPYVRKLIALPPAPPGAVLEDLSDHQDAQAWFIAEHPVLLAAIDQASATGFETHAWQLASTLTSFLDRYGYWRALAAAHTAALDSAVRRRDPAGQANAHRGFGIAQDRLDHPDDARTHYLLALELFGELGSHPGQARTHLHLARLSGAQGHAEQALDHARHSLGHSQAADDRSGQAAALNHIGWFRAQLGDHHRALTDCRQALALTLETEDLNSQAHTWDSLGYIHHHLGRHSEALDCYGQALALFRKTGDRHGEATGLVYLGDTHATAADHEAARTAWTQALTITEELGLPATDPLRTRIVQRLAAG